MADWRRVTREENFAAWKAKQYTKAAPGKFRKNSKTISIRKYRETVSHPGEKIEAKRDRVRRERLEHNEPAYTPSQLKNRQTRERTRELTELAKRYDLTDSDEDKKLIAKYLRKKAKLPRRNYSAMPPRPKRGKTKFEKDFTEAERLRFRELFQNFPEDTVRRWLGSDERSVALRANRRAA